MVIDDINLDCSMLIVEKFNQDILLGSNWCTKNNVVINYNLQTVSINDNLIDNKLVTFTNEYYPRMNNVESTKLMEKKPPAVGDKSLKLSKDQQNKLDKIVNNFQKVFSDQPGCTNT